MPSETNQTMNAQDWFGVGLRLMGFWSIFSSLNYFLVLIDEAANWSRTNSIGREALLLYTIGYAAFGLIIICNANLLTKLVYTEKKDPPDIEPPV